MLFYNISSPTAQVLRVLHLRTKSLQTSIKTQNLVFTLAFHIFLQRAKCEILHGMYFNPN